MPSGGRLSGTGGNGFPPEWKRISLRPIAEARLPTRGRCGSGIPITGTCVALRPPDASCFGAQLLKGGTRPFGTREVTEPRGPSTDMSIVVVCLHFALSSLHEGGK